MKKLWGGAFSETTAESSEHTSLRINRVYHRNGLLAEFFGTFDEVGQSETDRVLEGQEKPQQAEDVHG